MRRWGCRRWWDGARYGEGAVEVLEEEEVGVRKGGTRLWLVASSRLVVAEVTRCRAVTTPTGMEAWLEVDTMLEMLKLVVFLTVSTVSSLLVLVTSRRWPR